MNTMRLPLAPVIILCVGLIVVQAGGAPHGEEAAPEKQLNCGVMSAYIAARLFDRQTNLDQIAQVLNAGPSYDRDCSMLDLKQGLKMFGMQAEGVFAKDAAAYLRQSEPGMTWIVRKAGNGRPHFAVRRGTSGLTVIDAPNAPFAVPQSELARHPYLSDLTAEFLVIRDMDLPSGDRPIMLLARTEVNLGAIPLTMQDIVADIAIGNAGRAPLQIKSATSSCGCLKRGSRRTGDRFEKCGYNLGRF